MPNNEPKVRTRTKTRRGGDIVKTKTVTKGDGMKRIEKTKTKKGPMGSFELKSVFERGPKGRMATSSYDYKNNEGGAGGFKLEKTKLKSGIKTKRSSDYETYSEPAQSYELTRNRKVNIPAYESSDRTSMVKYKGKGMKSKKVKTTIGAGYDVYGNYIPEKINKKSKSR